MMLPKNSPVITIDGPSGTGKGTICHKLAAHLGWHVLDSGCIYRALAYAIRIKGIDEGDISRIVNLARALDLRFVTDQAQKKQIYMDDIDISLAIRTEQCGQFASKIAVIPEIREALLKRQRAFAIAPGLVTDGRDMGTVVFPQASLKIYLDASPEERAKRRYLQLQEKEINASLAGVVDELTKRDARDTARLHSPLKPAADAIVIDTTGLTIVQVFHHVLKLIDEHLSFR